MACFQHAAGTRYAPLGDQGGTLGGLLLGLMAMLLCVSPCCANPASGSSDAALRQQANGRIPWNALSAEDAAHVERVTAKPTLYRQLPTRVIDCDPELYTLLIDHPELVVDVWGVMGISKLRLERVAEDQYHATDTTGTVGTIRVLDRSEEIDQQGARHQRVLALAQGVYQAPPMPQAIRADSVLLFHSTLTREENGRTYVRADLDSFVKMNRPVAGLMLKTLSPVVNKTADHNFVETMRFISLFSQTAERNPDGMRRLADHLTKVDDPTRSRFVRVCYDTASRSHERHQARVARAGHYQQAVRPAPVGASAGAQLRR